MNPDLEARLADIDMELSAIDAGLESAYTGQGEKAFDHRRWLLEERRELTDEYRRREGGILR